MNIDKLKTEFQEYLDTMGSSNVNLGSQFAREMMVNDLIQIVKLQLENEKT